ncbi:MAG: hypothetical protein AB7G87_03810 [Clostridia bacterium]
MSNNVQLILELGNNFINVVDPRKGSVKPIEPDSLLSLLSLSNEKVKTRIGKLPRNTLDVTFEQPGDMKKLLMFVPKGRFNMKALNPDKEYKDIEHPAMLVLFELKDKTIVNTYIAVLKDINSMEEIKDNTPVYHWPYVHVSRFHVCWGNTVLPPIESLHQLGSIPYLFLDSYHVLNHYGTAQLSNMAMPELLAALETKTIALDDCLKPADLAYEKFVATYM